MDNWNRLPYLRPHPYEEDDEPWNWETNFLDAKTRALLRYLKKPYPYLNSRTKIRIQEALSELYRKGGPVFERIIEEYSFPYENGVIVHKNGNVNQYVSREEELRIRQLEEEEKKLLEEKKLKLVPVRCPRCWHEFQFRYMVCEPSHVAECSDCAYSFKIEIEETQPKSCDVQEQTVQEVLVEETEEKTLEQETEEETLQMETEEEVTTEEDTSLQQGSAEVSEEEETLQQDSEEEVTVEEDTSSQQGSAEETLEVSEEEENFQQETEEETSQHETEEKTLEQETEEEMTVEEDTSSQQGSAEMTLHQETEEEEMTEEESLKTVADSHQGSKQKEVSVDEEMKHESIMPPETKQEFPYLTLPYLTLPLVPFLMEHGTGNNLEEEKIDESKDEEQHFQDEEQQSENEEQDSETWEFIMSESE